MSEFNPKEIKMIIGIGNPGEEYENTYHNVGIMFIDALTKKEGLKTTKRSFSYCKKGGLLVVKSLSFMNRSGISVRNAVDYFKIKPSSLMIVHDDSDISIGEYKLSFGRGDAGHRGIRSIIQSLGTKDYWRARVGIRDPNNTRKAKNLVLNKIKDDELITLENSLSNLKEKIIKVDT